MITYTTNLRLRFVQLTGIIALFTLATGCSNSDSPTAASAAMLDASAARINYRFLDSSVPPPNHRSYTLQIDPESSVLTFDAYGENLGEQVQPTDTDKVDEVLNRLSMSDLPAVIDKDCVGGPTLTLKVSDASNVEVRSIRIAPCDDEDRAAVAELKTIIEPVLSLFNLE